MSALLPGHVPKGWTRGEDLRVVQLSNNPEYQCLIRRCIPFALGEAMFAADTVFEIRVPHSEWPDAQAWIDWWEA